MTNLELVLNMLAEATTSEISKEKRPKTMDENKMIPSKAERLPEKQEKKLKPRLEKK